VVVVSAEIAVQDKQARGIATRRRPLSDLSLGKMIIELVKTHEWRV
jgi:hypothetical protein